MTVTLGSVEFLMLRSSWHVVYNLLFLFPPWRDLVYIHMFEQPACKSNSIDTLYRQLSQPLPRLFGYILKVYFAFK